MFASRYRGRFRRDRFEVRKAFRGTIELIANEWDGPIPFEAHDLSPGGVFLPTQLLLTPGAEVVVCFIVPGLARELTIFGRVARVAIPRRRTDVALAGMGLAFVDMTPLERIGVRECLRGVPPPLPPDCRHQC